MSSVQPFFYKKSLLPLYYVPAVCFIAVCLCGISHSWSCQTVTLIGVSHPLNTSLLVTQQLCKDHRILSVDINRLQKRILLYFLFILCCLCVRKFKFLQQRTRFPQCITWLSLQNLIHAINRKREIWEAEKVYILRLKEKKILSCSHLKKNHRLTPWNLKV